MDLFPDDEEQPGAPPAPDTGAPGTAPDAPTPGTAPEVAAPAVEAAPDSESSTVQGQLRSLFDEGNPLLQQSRESATRYAARRGMQNSTMAAQAGEEAHYAAAMPIASQDAAHFSGLESTRLQGDINSRLQEEQFGFNESLQGNEFAHRLQVQRRDHVNSLEQITAQGDVQAMLQDNQFTNSIELMARELSNNMQLNDQQQDDMIERLNLSHTQNLEAIAASVDAQTAGRLQAQYLQNVTERQMQTSAEIQTIYQTEGLTAQQQNQAVENAQARMTADIETLGGYYASSPLWSTEWGMGNGGLPPLPGAPRPQAATPGAYSYSEPEAPSGSSGSSRSRLSDNVTGIIR